MTVLDYRYGVVGYNQNAAYLGTANVLSAAGAFGQVPRAQQEVLVPNTVVRILYDYVATERGVLSLRAGDVATLLEVKDAGWCLLKTTADQQGYFPLSYTEPASGASCGTTEFLQLLEGNERCQKQRKQQDENKE